MVQFQRERHEKNGAKKPKMASLPTALDNLENKLSFVNEAGNLDMGLNLAGFGKLENECPEHSYKKSGMSSLDMLLKPGAKGVVL